MMAGQLQIGGTPRGDKIMIVFACYDRMDS